MLDFSFYKQEWWCVYILRSSNGSLYTGCTRNLTDRIFRHNKGYVQSTRNDLPVVLIGFTAFRESHKAFAFEKYLKSGSGRAFKQRRLI